MVTNAKTPDLSRDITEWAVKKALANFEQDLINSAIFSAGTIETILKAKQEEADKLLDLMNKDNIKDKLLSLLNKDNLKPLNLKILKKINSFYLTLNSCSQLCHALWRYNQTEPALDNLAIPDDEHTKQIKHGFMSAYQQTLQDHIEVAKILLSDKDGQSQLKEIKKTTNRVNNLTAYIADPSDPTKLAIVAEDVKAVAKMKNTRRNKMMLGGLLKLIGYGVTVLGFVMGVAAAASIFYIGPVGLAGFAFMMGLRIAGDLIKNAGKRLLHQPLSEKKLIELHKSIMFFGKLKLADPNQKTSEKSPLLIYTSHKPRSRKH
jgi:hypothetical protein